MRALPQLCLLIIAFCFSSCLKEDVPVKPPDPGDVTTVEIPLGNTYSKQVFFDLGTNTTVATHTKTAWDLGFECDENGYHVILNSSKHMFAYNTKSTDFDSTFSIDVPWKWDVNSGNLDSTAIGDWTKMVDGNILSRNLVYLIDLGRNADNSLDAPAQRIKKLAFLRIENDDYHFRYANLDGTEESTFHIKKNQIYNFVYFSFDNGGERKDIAPPKQDWDLLFSQYTHIFSETPNNIPQPDTLIPYLVTGVLKNRNGVAVAEDISYPFDEIDLDKVLGLNYISDKQDIIGYDWKLYNFDQSAYDILPDKIYIVRDAEGFYYKLRFIDFYNSNGAKGYPKFEFQRL